MPLFPARLLALIDGELTLAEILENLPLAPGGDKSNLLLLMTAADFEQVKFERMMLYPADVASRNFKVEFGGGNPGSHFLSQFLFGNE